MIYYHFAELIHRQAEKYGNRTALKHRDNATGKWLKISWREFSDKVNAMSYANQRKMRPLFAYAARCELDNQGRTLIPAHLREYAHLGKGVAVIGCNNHAEIWDEESWSRISESEITPENIASVMDQLEF